MDGIRQQRNWATADAYPRTSWTDDASQCWPGFLASSLLPLQAWGLLAWGIWDPLVFVQTSERSRGRLAHYLDGLVSNELDLSGLVSKGPVTTTLAEIHTHAFSQRQQEAS